MKFFLLFGTLCFVMADLLFMHGYYTVYAWHSVYDFFGGMREWSANLWGSA